MALQILGVVSQANSLTQETALLRNLPGWSEMGAIIRARPALVKFEGQEQAEYKTTVALTQWGEKWNSSGPRIYNVYIELLRRSLAMEQDRLALEADLRRLNPNPKINQAAKAAASLS